MLPKTDTLKFAVLAAYLFLTADLSGQRAGFRDTIAGIPVNYDEQKVGIYTLPDLFRTHDGGKVKTPEEWFMKRRPEILDDFRENQFGFAPGRPEDMWFDVFDPGTPALNGMAVRKQVCVYFTGDTAGSKMDLLIYLPADANGPFPLLMGLNFVPNCSYIDDPGIRKGEMWGRDHTKVPAPERSRFSYFDPTLFLSRGIAYASVYYGDIEPDFSEGIPYGIRGAYLKPGETEPGANGWGAIAAWAWGLSRPWITWRPTRILTTGKLRSWVPLGSEKPCCGPGQPINGLPWSLHAVQGKAVQHSAAAGTARPSPTLLPRQGIPTSFVQITRNMQRTWSISRSMPICWLP
jgi:hypothetical protein